MDAQLVRTSADTADDLKLIHGIGPGLEARLHAAGILSYGQLVALSPDEVVMSLGNVIGLTVKRVEDQDWIGQARKLAPEHPPRAANGKAGRQHYATFTLELLLDEGNDVRRTRAAYIQGEAEDTWAGWDQDRLLDFLVQKSGLRREAPQEQPLATEAASANSPAVLPALAGSLCLGELRFTALQTGRQGRILAEYQPFEVKMTIDPGELIVPAGLAVDYVANVYAKELGCSAQQPVGGMHGAFEPAKNLDVTLNCQGLQRGMYRLRVNFALSLPASDPASQQPPFLALLDGGLLKIY